MNLKDIGIDIDKLQSAMDEAKAHVEKTKEDLSKEEREKVDEMLSGVDMTDINSLIENIAILKQKDK